MIAAVFFRFLEYWLGRNKIIFHILLSTKSNESYSTCRRNTVTGFFYKFCITSWADVGINKYYYIHFEITGDPFKLIGSH